MARRRSGERVNSAPQACRASTPGKVILMGEHAAVYGIPAVVAALNLRTNVEVFWDASKSKRRAGLGCGGGSGVALELPDLEVSVEVSWNDIDRLRAQADEQSRRHLEGDSDFVGLGALASIDQAPAAALFVAAALGEVSAAWVQAYGEAVVARLRSAVQRVTVASEAPLGAGCGSSAAVATAVVASFDRTLRAVRRELGGELAEDATQPFESESTRTELEVMALRVERYQHGRPSGVDTAAVLRGGVLRVQQSQGLQLETVDVADGSLDAFSVVFTGQSAEPTGAVVDAVRRARQASPAVFDGRFAAIGALGEQLISALRGNQSSAIGPLVHSGQRHLEALRIVPDPVRDLVRWIELAGAFAKVSGAGSLQGPGAGILLVYDPESSLEWRMLSNEFPDATRLNASLGAEGLRFPNVTALGGVRT